MTQPPDSAAARPAGSVHGTAGSGLVSVGYEGRGIAEFVADLRQRGVEVLADVRLNAISRKPGFGKSELRAALAAAGIDYVQLRALGNPRDNRAAFHGGDVARGREVFRRLLQTAQAALALQTLRDLGAEQRVAVMCFERDEQHCHRQVVIEAALDPELP